MADRNEDYLLATLSKSFERPPTKSSPKCTTVHWKLAYLLPISRHLAAFKLSANNTSLDVSTVHCVDVEENTREDFKF